MNSNFNLNEDNKQFKSMEIQEEKGTFFRPKWELKTKAQPHPARRWCHTSTIHGNNLYILGGRLADSAKPKQFAYKINCESFLSQQIQLTDNPLMRESHSCTLVNDSMYVFFGIAKSGKVLNDSLQLKITPNTLLWQIKPQTPEIDSRESHMSMTLDNRHILIYGGMNSEEKLIQDFYIYDTQSQTWRKVQKITGNVQVKVGGTLISIKNQIYLFGGQINDQNQYSNQIFKIQITNYNPSEKDLQPQINIHKLNINGPKPLPRSQFASVVYKDRYLIILGGQGPIKDKSQFPTLLGDIWSFDTEKMMWEEIVPQNPSIFKPRSSFTANIYKDNLIVFGGLVSFKDYKTTDQILVMNLNTQVEKRPVCSICKSSYKPIPKQQIQVQKSYATLSNQKFSTGIMTIFAISQTIQSPFIALNTLLHSFDTFEVEKCSIVYKSESLQIQLKNFNIDDNEWNYVLNSYEFSPLIQQKDPRVKFAIKRQVRQNLVNYLAYNIKNCSFRLGSELLISWINSKNELQICLMNKFGIYNSVNLNGQHSYQPSSTAIILQHLKQHQIDVSQLLQSRMNICITSLKNQQNTNGRKQLQFDLNSRDIIYQKLKFKKFIQMGFAQNLTYPISISNQQVPFIQEHKFQHVKPSQVQNNNQKQEDKWPQQNTYPDLFENIFTSQAIGGSLILVYQNNKLMHRTQLRKSQGTLYEFHLTKNIQPNLTFSDILLSDRLLTAIKQVIADLNKPTVKSFKRHLPCQVQQINQTCLIELENKQQNWDQPRKTVKTNETQNNENSMQIQIGQREDEVHQQNIMQKQRIGQRQQGQC